MKNSHVLITRYQNGLRERIYPIREKEENNTRILMTEFQRDLWESSTKPEITDPSYLQHHKSQVNLQKSRDILSVSFLNLRIKKFCTKLWSIHNESGVESGRLRCRWKRNLKSFDVNCSPKLCQIYSPYSYFVLIAQKVHQEISSLAREMSETSL